MIVAVILSAGESSRMGEPKALLPVQGQTFIERIVTALARAQIREIIVVLGHHAPEIAPKIKHLPVRTIVNEDYKKGQLSSLQAAIRSLPAEGIDGILVHLVDHPFVSAGLVEAMIKQFYESQKLIVVPRCKGRRGHPVIFSSKLFPELLAAPLERGAKEVVHAHQGDTLEIETPEEGVAIDIDTPSEYQQHVRVR
jgi:molybdenum cofactor cytidylyltransferase